MVVAIEDEKAKNASTQLEQHELFGFRSKENICFSELDCGRA